VIAEDLTHGSPKRVIIALGSFGEGIMTVRFTYRDESVVRINWPPDTGARESESMSAKIKYTTNQ